MITLVSKASTGKLKLVQLAITKGEDYYYIDKYTGYYNGKMTPQPRVEITHGLAKRTLDEQFELVLNHLIKEKLDHGYKRLEKPLENYTPDELFELVGEQVNGINGVPKPMLAKSETQITNRKVFDKEYYASRKIDGLRCLFYWDGNEVRTASRGGMNYDTATVEIRYHPQLVELFKAFPNLIMDTELYKHGLSLQQINAYARTNVSDVDTSVLQMYWYDVIDCERSFVDRLTMMLRIADSYNWAFDPNREFNEGELRIQVVPHVKVSGFDNMVSLHDQYVSEGFEGCVIRLATSVYKPNARTNDWIKIKRYQDLEAKVVGFTLGARGSEDMCFNCQLDNGIEFLAKVYGDRELKDYYYNHFEDECLGQMATVKYFYLSDEGVPLQPGVKSIRLKEDI